MADVWLATVDYSSVSVLGHVPAPSFDGYAVVAARVFVANDGTDAGRMFPFEAAHALAIYQALLTTFDTSGYEWKTTTFFLQKPFSASPFDWTEILEPVPPTAPTRFGLTRINAADGDNGAAFFGGGTLSVTKDYAMGHYVFSSPMGSLTVPFTWLLNQPPFTAPGPWAVTDTPLYAAGFGHALGYADASLDNREQTLWNNFYTQQNGVTVSGAALTAADPGTWDMPFQGIWGGAPGNYYPTGLLVPTSSGQQAGAYRSELDAPASPPGSVYEATREERYLLPVASAPAALDLVAMPEHDLVFAAWGMAPSEVMVRRSHDHGRTWTSFLAESGATAQSLSIQCFAGQVWICYYDSTHIVTQTSLDLGLTWSAAMPITLSGTNPRLVIAPDGTFFFFYFSGTTLVLSRSATLGASLLDATAIPITSGLVAQDFGAVLAADRSLVVSYIKGGDWESKRSIDWGNFWDFA